MFLLFSKPLEVASLCSQGIFCPYIFYNFVFVYNCMYYIYFQKTNISLRLFICFKKLYFTNGLIDILYFRGRRIFGETLGPIIWQGFEHNFVLPFFGKLGISFLGKITRKRLKVSQKWGKPWKTLEKCFWKIWNWESGAGTLTVILLAETAVHR